jgi:phosphoglycerate dehydrogenase-like enzyme
MLVIGLGKVGRRIAELSSALGIEVVGHRRSQAPLSPGVSRLIDGRSDRRRDCRRSTTFVLAAPDTPETRNLLSRSRLAMLPERAVVINVGRGSLIDEAALIERLADGGIRGAAARRRGAGNRSPPTAHSGTCRT